MVHASHVLYAFKGLVFCDVCGFVASRRVRKLGLPCGRDLPVIPTPQGASNKERIWQGLLPHNIAAWPADAPAVLPGFINLGFLPANPQLSFAID